MPGIFIWKAIAQPVSVDQWANTLSES